MDAALELKLLAAIQYVCFFYSALKVSLPTLVTFISYQMGQDAPPPDRIEHFLHLEKTQRTLEASFEVSLWKSVDGSWRLISLAPITDPDKAKRRLAEFPVSKSTQCAWCWQESKMPNLELHPEINTCRREPVPGRYLHRACARPWGLLRTLAESEMKHERI
ncbi:hypothetical protein NH8B_1860 [Pseudogulbenkiania sp. NH8B]|uniref:hypothetical protein n=1 Tax=Pseudogulbenkiania sp. (strain NH8B) TaxID=748280 RepID=UPI0002279EE5|nr:hypothetical protein [Pseudogulbenkiania sp. NH8B]BAK76676.1 hypothetical protein NH8B_1860 [Pseudogulbenkiania sp. NH8B]